MSEITPQHRIDFWAALEAQIHVIGALIMRELHTRYGRDNIGFLWVLGEPMMLASVIAALHVGSGGHSEIGIAPAPFWITGYTAFIMFRSIVSRAESAIESNRSLLYHRNVTLLDMLIARSVLEAAGTLLAMFVLLSGTAILGIGTLPQRPLIMLGGLALLLWMSFGLSLLICAGAEAQPIVGRLVHPFTYFSLPLSGAFFFIEWIPEPYKNWLTWFPVIDGITLVREGQFRIYNSHYVDLHYAIGWCMFLTLTGLLALKAIRARLHLE